MPEPKTPAAAPAPAAPPAPEAAAKPAEIAKPNRKAQYPDLERAEYRRLEYVHTPPAGTTLEEMLNPEYWAHVAGYLQPYTAIEVREHSGLWIAFLIVKAVTPYRASVAVDHVVQLSEKREGAAAAALPEGYDIKHRGAQAKWSVIDAKDGTPLKDGFGSYAAAELWLRQMLRELAA